MSTSSPATPANPSLDPIVHAVQWFGASERLIGGVPDAHYGWLDTPTGPCIIKALDPQLTAYSGTLLEHEREALARLDEIGGPIAKPRQALMDAQPHWIATEFSGLSLQRASAGPGGAITVPEALAAWGHLMRRLDPLARQGILVIDLYIANVLLPLARKTAGQLRLNEPVLVDHAHTVAPGMSLRRPVWLDTRMARIAPELRDTLQRDQKALREHFTAIDAHLPGYSRLPQDSDAHARHAWATYSKPQALQALIDSGQFDTGAAMQFAIGAEVARLLGQPAAAAALDSRLAPLRVCAERLIAAQPARRFESLLDASKALEAALGTMAHVSDAHWPEVGLDQLRKPAAAQTVDLNASQPSKNVPTRAADDATQLPEAKLPHRRPVPLRLADPLWIWACVVGSAVGGAAVAIQGVLP